MTLLPATLCIYTPSDKLALDRMLHQQVDVNCQCTLLPHLLNLSYSLTLWFTPSYHTSAPLSTHRDTHSLTLPYPCSTLLYPYLVLTLTSPTPVTTSVSFHEALLLSAIIAIPMLVDILLDAYYVFRFKSGTRK